MSFPRYPAYKDSGVEWLGEVPEHWNVSPLKRNFAVVGGSTPKTDIQDYWDGDIHWITPADLSRLQSFEIVESIRSITAQGVTSCGTTLVPPGSIIVSTRAPIGSLGIAAVELCTNQGCKALVPAHRCTPRFFAYFLSIATEALNVRGRGATFLELSGDELGAFKSTIPMLQVQEAIASFLDHETAKIDALIAEQQRLIELLKEKRQAVISHAVTKGLNPDAPMKSSGVEWLGEVPEHWNTCKLSYVADVVDPNPSHRNPEYTESGFPFISTIEFRPNGAIEFDTPRRVSEETVCEQEERCRFREGSLAFSRKGTIGAVRELPVGLRFALLDSLCVVNPSIACTSKYLRLYFESSSCEKELESLTRGAALPQVSVGDVRRLHLPLPPNDEQQNIAEYLRKL